MASWKGWKTIPGGGQTPDAPSAFGGVIVAVRGNDNGIYTNTFISGTSWEGWREIPGGARTPSAPAVTILNDNVYVFARGTNNAVFFNRRAGNIWSGWAEVPGGELTDAAPAAAPGVLLTRAGNGAIRFIAFDDGPVWRFSWADIPGGGRTPSAPAITKFGRGFFCFVRGTDDGIHFIDLGADRSLWGVWHEVDGGGRTPSAPAIANGLLCVRGTDNELHHNSFNGSDSWTGWQRVPGGGQTLDAPALAHTPGFFTLIVRGTDSGIHFNFSD